MRQLITRNIDVALLPAEMERIQADGHIAIVIDVLRASTTIVAALANGDTRVIPLSTVEAARARQAQEPDLLFYVRKKCPSFTEGLIWVIPLGSIQETWWMVKA